MTHEEYVQYKERSNYLNPLLDPLEYRLLNQKNGMYSKRQEHHDTIALAPKQDHNELKKQ